MLKLSTGLDRSPLPTLANSDETILKLMFTEIL